MVQASTFYFINKHHWLKEKKIFHVVFIEMQMYLHLPNCPIWHLEELFICNNINTHLNKNFHTNLSYHSFKPLFSFIQISARSSLKKFENEKWPKAGYLPLQAMTKWQIGTSNFVCEIGIKYFWLSRHVCTKTLYSRTFNENMRFGCLRRM